MNLFSFVSLDKGSIRARASAFLMVTLLIAGCRGDRSDLRITPEPAGENCQYGGVKVETGHDANDNGRLDDHEVRRTEYVCNQRVDGTSIAFDIGTEPVGDNCRSGGIKVLVGLDDSDDGILDPEEVDSTNYICHGLTRLVNLTQVAAGTECEQGGVRVEAGYDSSADGFLDEDEVDVSVNVCNGRASLLRVTQVEEGGACPAGGIRVQSGFDVSGNGQLETDEVQRTEYVCNGEDGYTAIVRQSAITPDPNGACYFGGVRFESGLDRDRDGILSSSEIETSSDVCSVQVNERLTLVRNSVELPGERCEYGGIKTEVGVDENDDRFLEASEITSTTYQCNELIIVDGLNTLVRFTAASGAQCPFGGQVVRSGLDENRNDVLESSEVDQTALICNGANGYNSLTRADAYSGGACGSTGGYRLQSGLDTNRNNVLDSVEVQATDYLCHGDDGFDGVNSLIDVYDAGTACGTRGGIRVETGLDLNYDGVLGFSEIESTAYICNGYNGYNSLIRMEDAAGACGPYGGNRIEVGLDLNEDGILNSSEVESYGYACHGYDGYSALIEAEVGAYSSCGWYEGMRVTVGMDYNDNGYIETSEVVNLFYICENWETFYY